MHIIMITKMVQAWTAWKSKENILIQLGLASYIFPSCLFQLTHIHSLLCILCAYVCVMCMQEIYRKLQLEVKLLSLH